MAILGMLSATPELMLKECGHSNLKKTFSSTE